MHPSGAAITIEEITDWECSLPHVARLVPKFTDILYVVYAKKRGWGIKGLRDMAVAGIASRKPLPKHWAGLSNGALDAAVGGEIPGAVFCHKALFVAEHKTRDGIMEMLRFALAEK